MDEGHSLFFFASGFTRTKFRIFLGYSPPSTIHVFLIPLLIIERTWVVLEMLLGMLEFLWFHESTEVKKDASLMNGQENGKHGGYENKGSPCDAFLMFRDNAECFFLLFL